MTIPPSPGAGVCGWAFHDRSKNRSRVWCEWPPAARKKRPAPTAAGRPGPHPNSRPPFSIDDFRLTPHRAWQNSWRAPSLRRPRLGPAPSMSCNGSIPVSSAKSSSSPRSELVDVEHESHAVLFKKTPQCCPGRRIDPPRMRAKLIAHRSAGACWFSPHFGRRQERGSERMYDLAPESKFHYLHTIRVSDAKNFTARHRPCSH